MIEPLFPQPEPLPPESFAITSFSEYFPRLTGAFREPAKEIWVLACTVALDRAIQLAMAASPSPDLALVEALSELIFPTSQEPSNDKL